MARRRTAKEQWDAASAGALKLAHKMYPYHLRRIAALNLPPFTHDMDDAAALRLAGQLFEKTPKELAALNKAGALYKPMQHGQNRTAPRKPTAQWEGSNDPLIVFIALWGPFPDLLTKPLRQPRIDGIVAWLQTSAAREVMAPKLRRAHWDEDTLARAIRRAKKRPQLVQLISELQTTK